MALIQLDLAELLVAEFPSERSEALKRLGSARTELAAMGMEPSVDRALRLARRSDVAGFGLHRRLIARDSQGR